MRSALLLVALACTWAHAEPAGRWWLGFIDQSGRAFLEIPPDSRGCAERDRLVGKAPGEPGTVYLSARSPAEQVPAGARLGFGVTDLSGHSEVRVFTRVAAIVREEERARASLPQACWYLAEAGADKPGYRALEDRLAIGIHPPRAASPKLHEGNWRSYGGTPARIGADNRFLAESDAPGWVRELVATLHPGADQVYAQPFQAVLAAGPAVEPLWLIGGVRDGDREAAEPGTYNTLNLIVAGSGADRRIVYQAGPSGGLGRDRAGSQVSQVVATLDLDGDGIDEILVRARHYAGGNLFVLRWNGTRFVVARQGGYEGE